MIKRKTNRQILENIYYDISQRSGEITVRRVLNILNNEIILRKHLVCMTELECQNFRDFLELFKAHFLEMTKDRKCEAIFEAVDRYVDNYIAENF